MTKRILVQKVKGPFREIEVTNDTTVEEARDFLLRNYEEFKPGLYKFIHNGGLLANPHPFQNIPANSKIIVFVKESKKGEEKTAPTPDAQPNQPQNNPPPPQNHHSRAIPPPGQGVSINITPEQLSNLIQTYMRYSMLNRVYDPQFNFWNNPDRVAEVSQILEDNIGAQFLIDYSLIEHFRPALRYSGANRNIILTMLGRLQNSQQLMTEYDADVQSMSNAQRDAFNRLQQMGYPKDRTLKVFKDSGYNEQEARSRLSQLERE